MCLDGGKVQVEARGEKSLGTPFSKLSHVGASKRVPNTAVTSASKVSLPLGVSPSEPLDNVENGQGRF